MQRHSPLFSLGKAACRAGLSKPPLSANAKMVTIFNSIVHKLQFGTWHQRSIYDDHIRLWNEGVLPEDYTVDTLMSKHTSKQRNPKMAQVFASSSVLS